MNLISLASANRFQHLDTVTTGVTTSTAISGNTFLLTSCQTSHWVAIGTAPVINTATSFIVPGNTVVKFSCAPGDVVAVRAHGTTGHVGLAY